MNIRGRIGNRGERLFTVLISEWCNGRPWFEDIPLGGKHEAKDFMVELIETNSK
jgi:hypothetical protein